MDAPPEDAAQVQRFNQLDKNQDGLLSWEEFKQQQGKDRGVNMYGGPMFYGEAQVPFELEMVSLARRIKRKRQCMSLLVYLLYLFVYMGIVLCYPVDAKSKMTLEVNKWVEDQHFGTGQTIADVETRESFWAWFDEVIVESVWGTVNGKERKGIILDFNNVVAGVGIAQRRVNFSNTCDPFEANLFDLCPRWEGVGDGWNTTSLGSTDILLAEDTSKRYSDLSPSVSAFPHSSRKHFSYHDIPLYTQNELGTRTYLTVADARQITQQLRQSNWVDKSTHEVDTILVLYNANTKLYLTLEIRFLMNDVGGQRYNIFISAFVLDPLGNDIAQAAGLPWQFRVSLEILFSILIALLLIKELVQIAMAIREGVRRAKQSPHKDGDCTAGCWTGFSRYFFSFWNIIDLAILTFGGLVIAYQIKAYIEHQELEKYMRGRINDFDGVMQNDILAARFVSLGNTYNLLSLFNTLCMLISFLRLFKYFEFHPRLGAITRTITTAYVHLVHIFLVLFLLMLGYATIGYIVFAQTSPNFHSFGAALGTMADITTMGIPYSEFQGMMGAVTYSWWGSAAYTLYYFSYLIIAFHLIAKIVLAVIVASYKQTQDELAKIGPEQDTVHGDFQRLAIHIRKKFGLISTKPQSSKVNPQQAFLVPSDAEKVRPTLDEIYTELSTIYGMLNQRKDHAFIPHRSIETKNDTIYVTFNYSDLSQAFSDRVAMYLWALYGPGAPEEAQGEVQMVKTEAEKREEKLFKRHQALEDKLQDLDFKLNVILATLAGANVNKTEIDNLLGQVEEQGDQPCAEDEQGQEQVDQQTEPDKKKIETDDAESVVSSSSEDPSSDSEWDETPKKTISKPVTRPLTIPALAIVQEEQSTDVKPKSPQTPEKRFAAVMKTLLDDGACPLQRVKDTCAKHHIPWDIAKANRRKLGILQYKRLVMTDGARAEHVVRFWKFGSEKELEQINKKFSSQF